MSKKLSPGDKAPDFALPGDRGEIFSLSAFANKLLVLYFYPKDDTSGCTQEAIDFNHHKHEFEHAGATVVGVSPDPVASHLKFKTKHKLGLELLSDESKQMLEDYGVWAEKSMYGRKYMGVERTTLLIDGQGRIVQIWNKVRVPGHVEAVLDYVRRLAATQREDAGAALA